MLPFLVNSWSLEPIIFIYITGCIGRSTCKSLQAWSTSWIKAVMNESWFTMFLDTLYSYFLFVSESSTISRIRQITLLPIRAIRLLFWPVSLGLLFYRITGFFLRITNFAKLPQNTVILYLRSSLFAIFLEWNFRVKINWQVSIWIKQILLLRVLSHNKLIVAYREC